MTGLARTRVVPRNQVLQTARGAARSAAPGIAIRVAARHIGTHMWTLRMTGRQGRRRATVSRGRAWFGRDERRRPWYSAAPDQTRRHRRAVEHIAQDLGREARRIAEHEASPREIHRRLSPDVRREEASPTPRLLTGVRLDVDENHFETDRRRTELHYPYELSPNMAKKTLPPIPITVTYPTGLTDNTGHFLATSADPPIRNFGPYFLQAEALTSTTHSHFVPITSTNKGSLSSGDWSASSRQDATADGARACLHRGTLLNITIGMRRGDDSRGERGMALS